MTTVLPDVLVRQRDRTIAAILGVKERECDRYLPEDVSRRFRKVVLDQVNLLHNLVIDVLTSLVEAQEAEGAVVVLNELWLDKIAEIHQAVMAGNGAECP